jgi:lysophospholipase L1-like esterase
MRILCFGDSNTYGYDPRSYFGSRYDAENRWVDLLAIQTGCEVLNAGQNGREIPRTDREVQSFLRLLTSVNPVDLLIIMLGSNDLLQGHSAASTASSMKQFLQQIPMEKQKILLVAPSPMKTGTWVTEERLLDDSMQLIAAYQQLAKENGYRFADTSTWNISMTFDGVHFSEAGHRAFAEKLSQSIKPEK